jgi:hypothetical protein
MDLILDPDPQAAAGALISYHEMLTEMRGNNKLLAGPLADYRRFVVLQSRYQSVLRVIYRARYYRKERFTRKQNTQRALRLTGGLLAGKIDVRCFPLTTQQQHLQTKHDRQFLYARRPANIPANGPVDAALIAAIEPQHLSTRRYEPNQAVAVPVKNINLNRSMNRRQRRALLYPIAQFPAPQAILNYYRPNNPYLNAAPLQLINIGRAEFSWAKGYPSVPTKALMREAAIAESVVFVWPERGSSDRCLQTTPALAPGPHMPIRSYHQNHVVTEQRPRCRHRYSPLLMSCRTKYIRGDRMPGNQGSGHHGRARSCVDRQGNFICRTSECRGHTLNCAPPAVCAIDHRRQTQVSSSLSHDNAPGHHSSVQLCRSYLHGESSGKSSRW